LGVYKVQETTKEKFVTNIVHVEMQCCHLYIPHHATTAYQTKHGIEDNDMV
jgi:hypothetical protein